MINDAMFQRLSREFDGKSRIKTTSGAEVTVLKPNVTKSHGGGNNYEGTTLQRGVSKLRVGQKTTGQKYIITDMHGNPQRGYISQQGLDNYNRARG